MRDSLILEIKNLHKSFGAHKVIDNVNLTVSRGDALGFIGPNGAGKTTTIRMILGLVYPDQGDIMIDGYSIKTNFYKAIMGVGAVVEVPVFYPYLSGYQNLKLIANLHRRVPQGRIDATLEMAGLAGRAGDKVRTYSLGMKQRLGIARALINNPKIVFLDEPMNGLDPQGMLDIKKIIKELVANQGITFFITSHLLKELEDLCNKVVVLEEGRLIAQGKVDQLLLTDNETVEIHTDNNAAAYALLINKSYIRDLGNCGDKLLGVIDKGSSGRITGCLAGQGIAVRYLIPVKETLENYYIQMTGRGSGRDSIN